MSASPSPLAVRREVELASGAAWRRVDDPERGALRRPARVAVDRVPWRQPGRQLSDQLVDRVPLVPRQRGVLGDPLDAEVDRVEEPARAGQVRRGLQRRQRLGGVQRVDQDEVGTELAGRPDGQVGEVGEVAEPPAAAGADAVELGREPPLAPPVGLLGEAEPGGRDDQVGARLRVAAAGLEQVVAERQVGRHRERRLADPAPVDLAGLDPVVDLIGPAGASVLELDPDVDGVAVGHVHRHPGGLARDRHHGRRQHPQPGRALPLLPCPLRVGGVDAHGQQRGLDRLGRHLDRPAAPVGVLRHDAVRLGELDERAGRGRHGPSLSASATATRREPVTGVEPATFRLQDERSTN